MRLHRKLYVPYIVNFKRNTQSVAALHEKSGGGGEVNGAEFAEYYRGS